MADVDYSSPVFPTSDSQTFHGFQLGGGLEHMLNGGLSLRAEYLYGDFGKETVLAIPATTVPQSLETHTVRAALVWNFGGLGR